MSKSSQPRILARLAAFVVACAALPLAHAGSSGREPPGAAASGAPDDPIEVVFPPGMHARLFHSLPIAGLLVTPDAVAQLVLMNPRLRATTAHPITGRGAAFPVNESGVVDTHADPSD